MKYYLVGALIVSLAAAPAALADGMNTTVVLDATVNTVCLDTRLDYKTAEACKERMARADTPAERQEVMKDFAMVIEGQTPLRNSLTSSGAGVKKATTAPKSERH